MWLYLYKYVCEGYVKSYMFFFFAFFFFAISDIPSVMASWLCFMNYLLKKNLLNCNNIYTFKKKQHENH